MKNIKIVPCKLGGDIKVPSSKSLCHRSIICASLSKGRSTIQNVYFSKDILATIEAMKSLGVEINTFEDSVCINGTAKVVLENRSIFCGESGSTLRFIIPVVSTLGEEVVLSGAGKLVERPLDVYYKIFDEQKICYSNSEGRLPLHINGILKSGNYKIKGDISSQFITGLLFALPLLEGDSEIEVTTELESKPYVDMTLDMLQKFNIHVVNENYEKFIVKGRQLYKSCDYYVETDFSQAAFFLVIGVLGNKVSCQKMNINSHQGDKHIVDILKEMGGNIQILDNCITAIPSKTNGVIVDAAQCPDLVPVIASIAAVSNGVTEIINASRLRLKESDRLQAISSQLNKIGADVKEKKDGLVINGKNKLKGGVVSSFNDHRIAMALASVSSMCSGNLVIQGADCVNKSYPDFWNDFAKIGGHVEYIED